MRLNRATIAILATAGVAMAGMGVAQADAAVKPRPCGESYTQLYGHGPKKQIAVSRRGRVGCGSAIWVVDSIYGRRGHVKWHCYPNPYGADCPHAYGYSTSSAIPGWRFWTGPGGGSARSKHSRIWFSYS